MNRRSIWDKKISVAGKSYAISLHSNALIQSGLKYNQYYEFQAIAKRESKMTTKSFWLKILNQSSLPKITVTEIARRINMIHLKANIDYNRTLSQINWYYITDSGDRININDNTLKEEMMVSLHKLRELKVHKIFASVTLNQDSSSFDSEGFYAVNFEPFKEVKPNELMPSIKIIEHKSSDFYKLVSIDIENIQAEDEAHSDDFIGK